MLYVYTKSPDYVPPTAQHGWHVGGILSLLFLVVGLFLVGQVIYPVIGWYILTMPGFSRGVVSPLASNFAAQTSLSFAPPVKASENFPTATFYTNNNSYRPLSWFPEAKPFNATINSNLKTYTVSIPKLKIDSATVEIGGDDLKKSLVAWPTSAVPGDYGANIIFGHSELPQFANPKDYSGIFTHLMDLTDGDVIFVDFDGVRYKYIIFDRQVIDPDDLSVLEQRFDNRYLTLITCVPPGTLWKRGVVRAKLSPL